MTELEIRRRNAFMYLVNQGVTIYGKQVKNFMLKNGEIKTFDELLFQNGNIRKGAVKHIVRVNYTGVDTEMQVTTKDSGGFQFANKSNPFSEIVRKFASPDKLRVRHLFKHDPSSRYEK